MHQLKRWLCLCALWSLLLSSSSALAEQQPPARNIEAQVSKAINRPTTEDDTHPSPVRRFSLASRVNSRNEPPASGLVWELFISRETLTHEMSALIGRRVKAATF
jgi:hypothetical protein